MDTVTLFRVTLWSQDGTYLLHPYVDIAVADRAGRLFRRSRGERLALPILDQLVALPLRQRFRTVVCISYMLAKQ